MALPNVLLIGAMKAGTTTVYFDLISHPDVFDADVKEVNALASDAVLTDEGRAAYERVFHRALAGQIVVDAGTPYAKRPRVMGVPERAVAVLPEGFRVIYVVREPVSRAISHHRHIRDAGETSRTFDDEVVANRDLIDFGRYRMQLRPWLEAVGRHRVLVVRTEDYVRDRINGAVAVQQFLGLDPKPDLIDPDSARNVGDGKAVHNTLSRLIAGNPVYRRILRPMLGEVARSRLKRTVMTRSRSDSAVPSQESVETILAATSEDTRFVEGFLQTDGAGRHAWDPEVVRERYRALREG